MRKKIGLALGGGGARGCAHVGVIKALNDAGIPIDFVAGTSVGALVGGIYASGNLEEFEKYLLSIKWKDVLQQFDPVFMKNGMFEGKKVVSLLNGLLKRKTFRNCKTPFVAVSTDLVTGKEVLLRTGHLGSAIRASISLPGIFTTVKRGKQQLMDGGLVNPLPVNILREMGADIVIAVDLNHQYIVERKKMKIRPKSNRLGIEKWLKPSYPNMVDVIEGSVFLMQDHVTQKNLVDYPADILLNLSLGSAGLFDFHQAKELIQLGYVQLRKNESTINNLINKK